MMRFLSLSLLGLCGVYSPVVVLGLSEVVVILYGVGAVVAMVVMHVMVFMLHVCFLRECYGVRDTAWVRILEGRVVLCLCVL